MVTLTQPIPKNQNVNNAAMIYEKHGRFIMTAIKSFAKNSVEAEDIYQEFFIKLTEKPIPDNIKNIKAFLYRALTRDILDSIRKQNAYNARIARYALKIKNRKKNLTYADKIEITEATENIFAIAKNNLPHHFYNAIEMRFRQDLSNIEVAQQLNLNSKSVGRYICIGLKKIRKCLQARN